MGRACEWLQRSFILSLKLCIIEPWTLDRSAVLFILASGPVCVHNTNRRPEVFFMGCKLKSFNKCLTCGTRFHPWSNSPGKYCSYKCSSNGRDYRGSKNPKWRGGKVKGPQGRVMVYAPGHHLATAVNGTYALEYRMVAEVKIGRALLPTEDVHHINGNPHDNRPENLQVMSHAKHAGLHSSKR